MHKTVIYTAIFGDRDSLVEPTVVPPGCDFVCFTDRPFRSNVWQVRQVTRAYPDDPWRSARMYKILPHRYLGSYETSIWVDGYIEVRGDVNTLIEENLKECDVAIYDHMKIPGDERDCIYDEADTLIAMAARGKRKDDPEIMRAQVEEYKKEGYPAHNGLISSMVMLRNHHSPEVVRAMEAWWEEVKHKSKRDQLSFDYIVWKHKLSYVYLPGNSRDNDHFKSRK